MKMLVRMMAVCSLLVSIASVAQAPAPLPLPPTPTTKILAIGRFAARPTPEQFQLLKTREVPDTVKLYLAGKIEQWYSLKEGYGVVFVLSMSSVEEARAMLEKLPLGQAKLMTFELIPIGPISPIGLLLPPEQAVH